MSITINKKRNEANLKISTQLYDFDKILESASEFTDSCWVYIGGNPKGSIEVKIKPKSNEIDVQDAANEFYNFVLGLMKDGEDIL